VTVIHTRTDLRFPERRTMATAWAPSASRGLRQRCRVCGSLDVVEVGRDRRAGLVAIRCNDCESHSAAVDAEHTV
jgi:hypothetical protein